MMTPVRNKVLALAFGCAACGANGMTLVEVYERALQEDAAIRAARATLSATNERLPQARAQLMPSVQASLSRNYNDLDTTTPNAFGQQTTTNSAYVSSGKTLTVRMPRIRMRTPRPCCERESSSLFLQRCRHALQQRRQEIREHRARPCLNHHFSRHTSLHLP